MVALPRTRPAWKCRTGHHYRAELKETDRRPAEDGIDECETWVGIFPKFNVVDSSGQMHAVDSPELRSCEGYFEDTEKVAPR